MSEYESPYFILMRRSEKALRALDTGDVLQAREILIRAQQEAEEALLQWHEEKEKRSGG